MDRIPENDLFEPARVSGERYRADVPDTLDLAERCRLGLHGLAGTTDPGCYYQIWFIGNWGVRQPYLLHNAADATCTPKFAESFPLLRTACGSEEYLDVETQQMANLLANISPDDGLYYAVWKPDRPWHSDYMPDFYDSAPEDWAWVGGVGRMARAMMAWQARDGDSRWDDRLRAMARGAAKVAIFRDDYAYYPDGGHSHQFAYPRSGWQRTDEPRSDTESGEGSVLDTMGHPIYGLSKWYMRSGDEEALELARKLTVFATLPKMWGGLTEEIGVHGGEQGHFHSHNHGHMAALRGLLEYAVAAQDTRVMEFVRRSYEHLRTYMVPRSGWFPSNGVGTGAGCYAEGCNVGDLVALGIRLSQARLGDYWDDVDAVVRNLLVEQQLTDAEKLRRVAEASPVRHEENPLAGQVTTENMPERLVGVFASASVANHLPGGSVGGCCSGNATQGLYYAWEGALRCEGDTAQINLLVNRASHLADVDSCLPYEGKVVIHNKGARRITVRILSWIDRRELQATVAGQLRPLDWVGSYLILDDLKPEDEIVLRFPVTETSVSYTAHHRVWRRETVYTYTFRGSTVVNVTPEDTSLRNIAIYDREHMRSDVAPRQNVTRFVPDKVFRDW